MWYTGIDVVITCYILLLMQREGKSTSEEILNRLLNGYDSRIPPYNKGKPVTSIVQLYIINIDSVSDSTMDYSTSIFLRQKWNDSRLLHDPVNDTDFLEIDTSVMDSIWTPDLYIVNEKTSFFHEITVPNKFMHIYPDGSIIYSMRITGTFSCPMELHKYPMDKQKCSMVFESYGYSTKTLLFRWHDVPTEKSPDMSLPQFILGDIHAHVCDRPYSGVMYTCIGIDFDLTREYGYYVIQVYLPSTLTVILSWVSFWITIDATPARTTLGLVTVLTITTQSTGLYSNLPRVSYIKAIDVWYGTCLLFVVCAFIEFAWVNVLSRVAKRKKDSVEEKNGTQCNGTDEKKRKDSKASVLAQVRELSRRDKARTVDKFSRVFFPLIFVIFNVTYWTLYLLWNP